jgi:transposase
MIVLGADTHKRSHTIAAVSATSGELLGEQTAQSGVKGAAGLLGWARGLGEERVWAIEDCRHVSGSLERFLIERGERVLRVHSTLMSSSRRQARGRGKADSIDALAVARAALREGLDTLPAAHLDGPELDLRLLVDHRERVERGWRSTTRCNGICTISGPTFGSQAARCFTASGDRGSRVGSPGPSRRCASGSPAMSCAASAN